MFSKQTYIARRAELRRRIGSGLILLPGNANTPNNYPNNAYYFRQDSTFRYFFGLNVPSVAGVIDADSGEEMLFGDDFTVEDIIWTGPQPTLREMAAEAGVQKTHAMKELAGVLRAAIALNRTVHYLPPYRGETKIMLSELLGIRLSMLHERKSLDLMFAVAEMRERKSAEEIEALERAFQIGYRMHTTAMKMCRAGVVEREIAGAIEGIAKSYGQGVSFPSIVSQHGETLHNLNCDGVLTDGRLLLVDAGGESVEGYCSDHTRTYPVSGRFTERQREIYEIAPRRPRRHARHRKAGHDVSRHTPRLLFVAGRGAPSGGFDTIVGRDGRRCRCHVPIHASRSGARHGHGRARSGKHRRAFVRLRRSASVPSVRPPASTALHGASGRAR